MKKKALRTEAVKVLYAPQYESLSIQKLMDFAAAYPAIEDYLPIAKDVPQLPRQVSAHLTLLRIADPACLSPISGSSTCATPSSATTLRPS